MERVWDYPRPPAVVPCDRPVRVVLGGMELADSARALRALETSHPPTIYVPFADVRAEHLTPGAARSTWCELVIPDRFHECRGAPRIGWEYRAARGRLLD